MPLPLGIMRVAASSICLASALPPLSAIAAEAVFENSRLYFASKLLSLLPQNPRPTLVRLTCGPGYRTAGYQFVGPVEPSNAYPDNWAPIEVRTVNYSAMNSWVLELVNLAEKPRPAFLLTVTYICIDTSAP